MHPTFVNTWLNIFAEKHNLVIDEAEGRMSDTIEQAFVPKVVEFPKQKQA